MSKRRDDAEDRLQKALVTVLQIDAAPNVFWCSIPNEGKRGPSVAARLKAMGMRAGAPDLFFIINGHPYGLELKAAADSVTGRRAGKQTPVQRRVEDDWHAAGGTYRVATGIDEATDTLKAWGALQGKVKLSAPVASTSLIAEAAE